MRPHRHDNWVKDGAARTARRIRPSVCPDASRRSVGLAGLGARLARLVLILALAVSVGLHWGFLQSVAWVGMVVNYSRNASFAEALGKTFDGKHPCKLCQVIQKRRAEGKQQDQQRGQSGPKLEPAMVWHAMDFDFSCAREDIFPSIPGLISRSDPPPKPRPRTFSASLA
jgi:hypothetical protein